MRKTFLSMIIAGGLAFTGAGLISCENVNQTGESEQTEKAPEQRSDTQAQRETNTQQETETQSQITLEGKIQNVQGSTLRVQGDSKQAHTFKVPNQQELQGLKSGDEVTITIIPQPMIQTEGEVTQNKGGNLQIRNKEGGTYSIQSGDSEELKNLKPGNKVQISIEKSSTDGSGM